MRPSRFLFVAIFIALPSLLLESNADAQGLIRRLRNRIAPLIQNPPPGNESSPRLPARPLPANPQSNSATDRSDRSSNGAVTRIPSITPNSAATASPAPAADDTGINQAGATAEGVGSSASNRRGFGRSILAPLIFGDNSKTTSSNNSASTGQRTGDSTGDSTSDSTGTSMGIKAIGANPGYPAVQVTEFLPHSLADEAGLQVGDYIFAIDGVPTPKVAILAERVAALRPGERVRLRIGRSGRVFDLEVPLASRVVRQQNPATANQGNPAADYQGRSAAGQSPRSATEPALAQRTPAGQLPNIGAEIADVPGQRGAVVSGVQLGSIAASAGLKIDDRIVAVDGRMVYDMKSIVELLSAKKMGTTAAIRLIRDNELVDATLSFDPKAKQPADESGQAVSNDKGSILGGLGSVFGGMFSGKPLENEGGKPADALNAPSTEKDSEPNLAGKDPLELPPPTSPPAASDEAKKGPPNTRSTEEKSDDPETIKKEIQRLRDQLESLESKLEK